jgi:hypothetical protein
MSLIKQVLDKMTHANDSVAATEKLIDAKEITREIVGIDANNFNDTLVK